MTKDAYKPSLDLIHKENKKWFHDKGLENFTKEAQAEKNLEEAQEVKHAQLHETREELMLEIGDNMVTLTGLCELNGFTLAECYLMAHNKITKRTGNFVDGSFVKDGE